jgi:hypothetical protein
VLRERRLARQRELLRGDAVKDAANAVQVAEINQKIEDLKRTGAQADAVAQYEKLLRTIEADGIHARQNQANSKQAMLDQLAVDEMVGGDFRANLKQGVLGDAKLSDLRLELNFCLGEMLALRLGDILRLRSACTQLHGYITVSI